MFLYFCWSVVLNEDSLLPLNRLYSGTLVHSLYQELKSTPSVENMFSSSPKMTQLYQVLLNTVKSSVSPDFFQKVTETKSESRKKKKASKKRKAIRCPIPETQNSCDFNRFASLGVDDWKHYSWNNFIYEDRNYISICDCVGICFAVFYTSSHFICTKKSSFRDLVFL